MTGRTLTTHVAAFVVAAAAGTVLGIAATADRADAYYDRECVVFDKDYGWEQWTCLGARWYPRRGGGAWIDSVHLTLTPHRGIYGDGPAAKVDGIAVINPRTNRPEWHRHDFIITKGRRDNFRYDNDFRHRTPPQNRRKVLRVTARLDVNLNGPDETVRFRMDLHRSGLVTRVHGRPS